MKVNERPAFLRCWDNARDFRPFPKSAYILAESIEDRSRHSGDWEQCCQDILFASIREQSVSGFVARVGQAEAEYLLRSESDLTSFISALHSRRVYLDMTGLDHSVWASLLRIMLFHGLEVTVIYAEPSDYRPSALPTEGTIFDLSERIQGVSPLPGFISLSEPPQGRICFVPMLGFEGARFAHLLESVQPLGEKVVPIVGVPGFRPEYPFYAYLGNRLPLTESQSWRKVRFATANCPFAAFYLLRDIHTDYPGHTLKLAPIGTKPHALGALLYAISAGRPGPVELVYDHPIRKKGRTEGTARLFAYEVWKLIRHYGQLS